MTIDKVHDLQKAFRKLVIAHSFPGRLVDITQEMVGIDSDLALPPYMILAALILLDAETTFFAADENGKEAGRLISQLTYASGTDMENADFIFVSDREAYRREALEKACEGTLENPHLGATIVMELASFHSDDDSNQIPFSAADAAEDSAEWILNGPGISGEKRLWTSGKSHWMDRRNSRNSEYPLGLDLILVHSDGFAAALPRTTRINRVGKEL